jgi:hypothetical protein
MSIKSGSDGQGIVTTKASRDECNADATIEVRVKEKVVPPERNGSRVDGD